MYEYMVGLMQAPHPAQVPAAPPAVAEYLEEHSSLLGAGVSSTEDLPTTGMLWWRATDTARLSGWAFANRTDLWGMFYGDLRRP